MKLTRFLSLNYDDRPWGAKIKYLIYHYTATGKDLALQLLSLPCQKNLVSAHYMICEQGEIYHLVEEDKRAWHAGTSAWGRDINLNATSIGIELVHPGPGPQARPYTDRQMQALIELSQYLVQKYFISPFHVLGHSDIAPGRKIDPGAFFDWKKLADKGVGVMPVDVQGKGGIAIIDLQESLSEFGYAIGRTGVLDAQTKAVLSAFQMHYGGENIYEVMSRLTCLLDKKAALTL